MYSGTHFNNKDNFEVFVRNRLAKNMEDQDSQTNFGLKNVYNLCKAKSVNPENSQPYVNELKLNSDGVWECDIHIPVQVEKQTNMKSIYRHQPKFSKCGFSSGNSENNISSAETDLCDDEQELNSKKVQPGLPGGKFIPVFGHNGCNFPPDYRLVNSRAGAQYRLLIPGYVHRPVPPAYLNNQFLRANRLARWNSLERDEVDNWDPFNLKKRTFNNGLAYPHNFNQHLNSKWAHNNRSAPFSREILVYPNYNFHHSSINHFNRHN